MEVNNTMGRDMDNRLKWERNKLKQYALKLNRDADKDVIDYLDKQSNKRAYIIGLIRADIKKQR